MGCKYWHIDIKAAQLCPDGKKCRTKFCKNSHDKAYPFCARQKCNMTGCNFTHPCKYGIKCFDVNNCVYDHPFTENILAIGKSNLLYAASKSAETDLKYFNIKVLSYEDLCMNVMDWHYMKHMHVDFTVFDWQVTETSYIWIENEVFQNFANEHLGGGTLRLGNVQEEIMMRSLGLLQYLYRGCQDDKMNILSSNLKDNPLLIDTYVVVKDKSIKEHYGNNGLVYAAKNENILFEPIKPFKVKIMCIAMTRLDSQSGSSYNMEMLYVSLESLIKAYIISFVANELDNDILINKIHIGNIGCGVFNHNYNVIYVLQKIAVSVAILMIASKKKIHIEYHTYDHQTMMGLKENAMPASEYFAANNLDVSQVLEKIIELQNLKPEIWAKKI